MLLGAGGGGYLAQWLGLGAPYLLRAAVLVVMFVVAALLMHDLGFTAERGSLRTEVRTISRDSVRYGLAVRPIRWLMLAALCTGGVGIYVGYALQPQLLDLWGDEEAYGIAGLAAALLAAAQIVGGLVTPRILTLFRRRTDMILVMSAAGALAVLLIALIANFWVVLALIAAWGVAGAAVLPVRQTYLNGMIPSRQRATILSFDSLMSSTGGVVAQPLLGRSADVWGYPVSFALAAALSAAALPFVWLSRRERAPADTAATVAGAPVEAG
jgi:MFS family permease